MRAPQREHRLPQVRGHRAPVLFGRSRAIRQSVRRIAVVALDPFVFRRMPYRYARSLIVPLVAQPIGDERHALIRGQSPSRASVRSVLLTSILSPMYPVYSVTYLTGSDPPRHALSRAAAPARSVRVARSPRSLAHRRTDRFNEMAGLKPRPCPGSRGEGRTLLHARSQRVRTELGRGADPCAPCAGRTRRRRSRPLWPGARARR
jgi:hypothetical protein